MMEKYKKIIGVVSASILIGAALYAMATIKAAFYGISLGVLLVALIIGAAWGLSSNK